MKRKKTVIDEFPWRRMLESSTVPTAVTRLSDGLYIAANRAFLRVYGLKRSAIEGRTSIEVGVWAHPAARQRMVAKLRSGVSVAPFTLDYRARNGRIERAVATTATFLHDGERYLIAWLIGASGHDAATVELRRTRALLNALFANATGGYAHCVDYSARKPLDFVYLHANAVFQRLIGKRRIVGRRCSELGYPLALFAPQLSEVAAKVARDGKPRRFVTRGRDSARSYAVSLFSPARGEFVVMLDDVTDAQHVADELKVSAARLAVAVRATRLVIFHQDRNLRYTWIANPALGVTARDILGRTDVELLGREAAAELVRIKRRVLRSGRAERNEVFVTNHGRSGWYDLIVEARRDADGRIVGILCAASDITERKRQEAAIVETNRKLAALTAHLQDAREDERRHVVRDLHDDVGAALTDVQMRLEQIAMLLPPGPSALRDKARAAGNSVRRAAAAMRRMTMRLRPSLLDDLGLVEACRWYANDWSATSGIALRGTYAAIDPNLAESARTDLFRILQELLTNVSKHARATRVSVSVARGAGRARLRVTDNGRGMTKGTHDGFGLAGVRERAARHGGTVAVTSGADGTRVTVTL